ncbi:class I SAM-dependent methyltransferase [Streptomyces sp. LE64]|jgi:toxoflavin synthase|uniref:class I SAM-dependent methyltransferase n=1 Tax=unclassified Streptomyces TaxID=2593676 RepID=UPI0033210F0E
MQKSAHHDRISEQYQASSSQYDNVKNLPYAFAERETLLSGLPDLTGKRVLDVACGTGYYSRIFKRLGASRVVGVDLEQSMVDVARTIEEEQPLGITYQAVDAAELPVLGEFDVVAPIWAFVHAKDADEYREMAARCAQNLVSGGTLVALCANPDIDLEGMSVYPRYGLSLTPKEKHGDRQVVHIEMDVEPHVGFDGFFWPAGTTETALEKAGFVDVQRLPNRAPGHLAGMSEKGYWAPFVANPPFALYTAVKP